MTRTPPLRSQFAFGCLAVLTGFGLSGCTSNGTSSSSQAATKPTATVTNPTAPSGQTPAATIDQVAGSWTTTSVLGRPVSATGPAWTIQFAGKGHAGTWQATDGCNQFSGGLTVGPAGTFEASVAASTMKLCSGVVVGPNVAIITTTRHVTVEQGAPAQLSVFDGQGRLLGTYKAQP